MSGTMLTKSKQDIKERYRDEKLPGRSQLSLSESKLRATRKVLRMRSISP